MQLSSQKLLIIVSVFVHAFGKPDSMANWNIVYSDEAPNVVFKGVSTTSNAAVVYGMQSNMIIESVDDGKSWVKFAVNSDVEATFSAIAPSGNGDVVHYAKYGGSLYVHNSSGNFQLPVAVNNWTALATSFDGKYVYALVSGSTSSGGEFWRSLNFGASWAAQWVTSERPYADVTTDKTGKSVAATVDAGTNFSTKNNWMDYSTNYGGWGYDSFVNPPGCIPKGCMNEWNRVVLVSDPYFIYSINNMIIYATTMSNTIWRTAYPTSYFHEALALPMNVSSYGGDIVASPSGQFVFVSAVYTGADCDSQTELCGLLYQSLDCGTTWDILFDHGKFFKHMAIGRNGSYLYGVTGDDANIYQLDISSTKSLLAPCPAVTNA